MHGVRTILHPTDLSEWSESAMTLAVALAHQYQARLVLLHVVPTPAYYSEGFVAPDLEEERAYALEQFRRLEPEARNIPVESRLEHGPVAQQILHVA